MLAIDGGEPAVKGHIAKFNTIGIEEAFAVADATRWAPLSGYLGGELHGGLFVEKLERKWEEIFGVKHAVAVNSGTSGLLVACLAAGVVSGSNVVTTPFTMSATAAAPAFLGAKLFFGDIEDQHFCLDRRWCQWAPVAIITNLFGHPGHLAAMRERCDEIGSILIEDNAQGFGAIEYGKYAGTIGHMGCWSLNVHKHIQAGEGGIVTTDDDALAHRLRLYRNHGELGGDSPGLNLRMVEPVAAIALAQLDKRDRIISERIEIAETLTDMVKGLPGITPPVVREGCKHVYYCWAAKIPNQRDWWVEALCAEGVPIRKGYVEPLYKLPAFQRFAGRCPNTEAAQAEIALWENCAHSPSKEQLKQIGQAFAKVAEHADRRARDRA